MKKLLTLLGATLALGLAGCSTTTPHQAPEPQQVQTVTPELEDQVPHFDVRTFGSLQNAIHTGADMVNDPNNTVPEDEILFQITDACVGYISEERPLLTSSAMVNSDMTPVEFDKQAWIAERVRELYIEELALMEAFVNYGGNEAEKDFDISLELYGETMSACVMLVMMDMNFPDLVKRVQAEYMKDKQEI